jgi:uncharacterized protein (TIGR02246 family)
MADFADALAEHLAAIQHRDLDRLAATVADGELTLVTSAGEVLRGRDVFLALHRDWFASSTWSLTTRELHARIGGELATVLLELDYRDTPAGAAPLRQQSVLTLVFARENERWLLVHDQNTPVVAGR